MPGSDRLRLVVLFGGQSAEHDVSCVSAYHVLRAADPSRYDLDPIGITKAGEWVRADRALDGLRLGSSELSSVPGQLVAEGTPVAPLATLAPPDDERTTVVLPLIHGTTGEDGTLQGVLELVGVPYVGTGVLGSALCMDKLKAKDVLAAHGIPQVPWIGCHESDLGQVADAAEAAGLRYPLFVKPANCGSSVGVSRVADPTDLAAAVELAARYDEWLVIEEGAAGREIEVAVLGNTAPRASVPGEITPAKDFYDYEDKYLDGAAELTIPARLPATVTDDLRRLACQAYSALRCEGMARVDFFYEDPGRGLLLNEINTIPGFTPISMYPKMWDATGLPYAGLIDELVRLALERRSRRARFSIDR